MGGIVIYWIILLVWAAVVTYFIVFDLIPMLNGDWHPKKKDSHGKPAHHHQETPEAAPGYSIYEGFKSFADKEGKLTTEDIVKGLSRHEEDL